MRPAGKARRAHIAPFLFTLSCFFERPPFRRTEWTVGGMVVTAGHFHLLIAATLEMDVVFRVWPRLMESFTGF